jgi:hypothetical protein
MLTLSVTSDRLHQAALSAVDKLMNKLTIAFFLAGLSVLTSADAATRPLGVPDISALSREEPAEFNKKHIGKLFTGQMTVGYVQNARGVYGVRFTTKDTDSDYFRLVCFVENEKELIGASEGEVLWVSGIVTQSSFKGQLTLSPCEISVSKEPWVTPEAWKLHPRE